MSDEWFERKQERGPLVVKSHFMFRKLRHDQSKSRAKEGPLTLENAERPCKCRGVLVK